MAFGGANERIMVGLKASATADRCSYDDMARRCYKGRVKLRRVALIAGGVGAVALVVAGVAAWLAERRRKTVFAAKDAPALLNPLRHVLMPVGSTLKAFGIAPGETVLELGPGPGYFTAGACEMAGRSGRVVCLDLQREMIAMMLPRAEATGLGNVDGVVGNAQMLPFRSGAIDRAFLVTVLGEVPEPEVALAELRRVLRPGGAVAFCETLLDPDYVRTGVLRGMCGRAGFVETKHVWLGHGYIACFRAPGRLTSTYPHPPLQSPAQERD
jgi:SAM-dependent methyltransferase